MMTRSNYRHLTSLILTFLIQGVFAANIVVNTTTDDENAGDGKCTLHEAINNANTDSDTTSQDCKKGSGNDVIELTSLSGQIFLDWPLRITSNIQFKGPGANNLTVDGNDYSRIFKIESMARVVIEGLTIAHGRIIEECSSSYNTAEGGGIHNSGTLTIKNSVLLENHAEGADLCGLINDGYASNAEGGAIFNSGILTINGSTFLNNSAIAGSGGDHSCIGYDGSGGGIYNSGTLYVENSTFSNNLAEGGFCDSWFSNYIHSGDGYGGGIHNANNLNVKNSTFVKNSAIGGSATVNWQEVAGTGGQGLGGGISTQHGVSQIINSTFSQNSVIGGDSYGENKDNKSGESYGGGIYIELSSSKGQLINNTLFGNLAKSSRAKSSKGLISRGKGYGGGIASRRQSSLSVKNTIITNSLGEDCYTDTAETAKYLESFNNLIKDGTCNPKYTGNPRLGVLRNNGGTTMTHRLLIDSIARDTGDDAICAAVPVNGLDQRGAPRTGILAGSHCDIGAFELQPSDLVELVEFTAIPNEKNILFKWETGAERYSAGFYLWQAEPLEGNCEQFTHEIKLTDKAILPQGNENGGAYYEYLYEGPVNVASSCYGLEERETSGKRNFYIIGPGIEKWKTFSIE